LCALAPKKPWAEPVLKKKVASIKKVEDQFDDIFEEVASGSLYSEGSWDESESSSKLVAEIDEWVSGFYVQTVSCWDGQIALVIVVNLTARMITSIQCSIFEAATPVKEAKNPFH